MAAQLARYERGVAEPSVTMLRRLLAPLGWVPTFGLEPTTAVLDEQLERGCDPVALMGLDAVFLLEIVALAAREGVPLMVSGEAAAVLQGVASWLEVPVADLAGLLERGELGPSAEALTRRLSRDDGPEPIT